MSRITTAETSIEEQFQIQYPNRRPNEAALFVEKKVILRQDSDLSVFNISLDQFVSREKAQKQLTIRFGKRILIEAASSNLPIAQNCGRVQMKKRTSFSASWTNLKLNLGKAVLL
jgi:hypothetical protein